MASVANVDGGSRTARRGSVRLREDVDWSLRAREAGYEVCSCRRLAHGTASRLDRRQVDGVDPAFYYGVRNTIVVCERHRPLPIGLREARQAIVAGRSRRRAALGDARGPLLRAVLDGALDARRGRLGQRSALVGPQRPLRRLST